MRVREGDERTLSLAVGNDNTAYATMTPSPPIETQLAHFMCLSSFSFLFSRILYDDTHASSSVDLLFHLFLLLPSMIDRTNGKKREKDTNLGLPIIIIFSFVCSGVLCCNKVVHVCHRVLLFEGLVGWFMERAREEALSSRSVACVCC